MAAGKERRGRAVSGARVAPSGHQAASSTKSHARTAGDGKALGLLQTLRERIAAQDLPPGSKLIESDLAAEFGVSRARIRGVLGVLEQRGLIERMPNRGAVVTRLTTQQVLELYDTREVLEGLAVRLATQNNPVSSWNDLIEAFGQPAEEAISSGDVEIYARMLDAFRRRIIEGCANELLAALLDTLLERTGFVVRRLILMPGRAAHGLQDHRNVLAAMSRGEACEAERLKRANIRSARDCFVRYQKFVL